MKRKQIGHGLPITALGGNTGRSDGDRTPPPKPTGVGLGWVGRSPRSPPVVFLGFPFSLPPPLPAIIQTEVSGLKGDSYCRAEARNPPKKKTLSPLGILVGQMLFQETCSDMLVIQLRYALGWGASPCSPGVFQSPAHLGNVHPSLPQTLIGLEGKITEFSARWRSVPGPRNDVALAYLDGSIGCDCCFVFAFLGGPTTFVTFFAYQFSLEWGNRLFSS